jgi:hypothetical protein
MSQKIRKSVSSAGPGSELAEVSPEASFLCFDPGAGVMGHQTDYLVVHAD